MSAVQNISSSLLTSALAALGLQQIPSTVEGKLDCLIALGSASAEEGQQYAGTPTQSAVTTAAGDTFTIGAGERGFIQNLATTALAVKFGTGASSSSFNFILKAGTAQDDGQGGSVFLDDYTGVVSVAAMTGSVRMIAWMQSLNA